MKKYSLLMGLMCAALSITSCSKDNTETFDKPKGYEFELYAAPQTRTEVDGLDMKWSANDAMNVFHAPTGTTNYSSNDQFTLAEIESGRFTGLITDTEFDPNGTYDWYVLYPYKSQKTTPALDEAYFGIGSYATSVQTQKGINNQDHICGVDIPLYGKVTNTTGSPSLQMHHIATLFRINVINTGSADLNVTSITLTSASENLIGTYYLDITGDTPVVNPSDDNYVSKTATLNVTDGIVAPDATGSFYLATRAFTAPEGEQLTLTVTANGETVEKVATLSKETTFAAGNINKLNINVAAEAYVPAEYAIITNPADIDVTATYFIGGNNEETVAASPTMHMFTGSVVTGSNDWRLVTKEYTFDSSTNTFNDITGIAPVTLENAGVENTYYIKVGENYLCNISTGTTSGKKGLALQPTDPTAWTFETDTKKEGIYASSTLNGEKYILSCNGSSDALRLYGNTKYNGIYFFTEAGTPKTALDAPTNVETALEDANTVYVGWDAVQGAASYTVSFEPATIEPQTIESTGETSYAKTFTLDYATEYTVSVVANPADTENYKASAPATATFTTGEDPNQTITPIGEITTEGNYTAEGTVVARGKMAYIIADNTGAMMVYHNGNERAVGEKISISGAVELYSNANGSSKSTPQFTNTATVKVLSTDNVWTYNPTAMDGTAMDALLSGELVCQEVQFEGNLEISGNHMNVTIPGASTATGSIKYVETSTVEAYNGKDIIVKGYYVGYSSNQYVNVLPYSVEEANPSTDPAIKADPTSLSFAAAGESKEVTYTAENLGSNQVFAEISGDGAGQFSVGQIGAESITVTAVENTETTAKTATLTLYIAASKGGEHLTETIVALTQAGVSSGEAEWHAESWSTLNQSANTYGAGSISGDLGTWEYTGCSGYDMEQFNTKKSLALGKTSDNSSITSPTFANGISGIKFNYFANNTARTILVTIYENGVSVKQETITPTSKNQLGTATIDITTSGPTYFTFTPGSSDRRVSIGDIEVNY